MRRYGVRQWIPERPTAVPEGSWRGSGIATATPMVGMTTQAYPATPRGNSPTALRDPCQHIRGDHAGLREPGRDDPVEFRGSASNSRAYGSGRVERGDDDVGDFCPEVAIAASGEGRPRGRGWACRTGSRMTSRLEMPGLAPVS